MAKKEILSVLREPVTLVQMIIPLSAIIPVIGIMLSKKNSSAEMLYIIPPIIVFITASVTSSMAWMVASVEEARDLLKSSPKGMMQVYIAKAMTALLPAFIEIIIFALIFMQLGAKISIIVFVFAMLANVSMIMVEFANVRPAKRPKMMQKPDRSIVSIIFAFVLMMLWATSASVAVYSFWWSLIPTAITIAVTIWSVWGNKDGQENYIRSAAVDVWSK